MGEEGWVGGVQERSGGGGVGEGWGGGGHLCLVQANIWSSLP